MSAVQALVRAGVDVVIAGNIGPKAAEALLAAGIDAYQGIEGTVAEAVEAYAAGRLTRIAGPTVARHWGTGRRQGYPG